MPYAIAVLVLIVVGVGFTLFQSKAVIAEDTLESAPLESVEAAAQVLIATNTPDEINDAIGEVVAPEIPVERAAAGSPPTTLKSTVPVATPTPAPTMATDYKNGSYTTQASYRTPDGTYQVDVHLTVTNDTIIDSTVSFDAEGTRDRYSKRFSSSYKSAIIGQDLGTANLSRVGGASLTTRAFNNALASIRTQAAS